MSVDGQKGWLKASSLGLEANAATGSTTVQKPQELPANVATVKDYASLYSLSTTYSQVLSQLEKGAALTVRRTTTYNNERWVYATSNSSHISGWVQESLLNMPDRVTGSDLETTSANQSLSPHLCPNWLRHQQPAEHPYRPRHQQ